MADTPAVVIDNGSGYMKAGFAGNNDPQTVFPTIVGRDNFSDAAVGHEALARQSELSLNRPINHGFINHWNDMEAIWHHIYDNELGVSPEEQPVLMNETPLNPKSDREELTRIMFEAFNVPAFYVAIDGVLALRASGRTTGVTVDCGHDSTRATPVYEGMALAHAILRLDVGGDNITKYLSDTWGNSFSPDIVQHIKEQCCGVAADPFNMPHIEHDYQLPDGQNIKVAAEQVNAPELLFQPAMLGLNAPGLHELSYNSIFKCDTDVRRDLYGNVLLSGGTTLLPGFAERVQKEVTSLAPQTMRVKVEARPERQYMTWIGGSTLAALPEFEEKWISKQEYDEAGPGIVHRKCF